MRWKEQFLVPDHRVRSINGASYAGFYYICIELGSLMGALHADALERPAPVREERGSEERADVVDEVDAEMSLGGVRTSRGGRNRSRRSVSRNSRSGNDPSTPHPSTPTVRIPDPHFAAEEDKSIHEYTYGQPPSGMGATLSSSSVTPTAYAPSMSPVTGANRIRRGSGATGPGATGARRRRLSIYSAGSVQAQMMDHGHPYGGSYAHEHSPHPRGLAIPGPSTSASGAGYAHSGYGLGPPHPGDDEGERGEGDDEIMGLEDALALDPIAERENGRTRERERERERVMDGRRGPAVGSTLQERYAATAEGTEADRGCSHGHDGVRKGVSWVGGGPARLTGYYYHSERDYCDL